MSFIESLPDQPLPVDVVEGLGESGSLLAIPVSLVRETGLVRSMILSPEGSDLHVGVGFSPDEERWVEIIRVDGREGVWERTEEWAHETYEGQHHMESLDLDTGNVESAE